MKKLELSEIKQIELNILLCFRQFCEENHLRFSLAGGTLLGAIRHHGFIPWDDDIDVCMPRPDYEKLLKLFKGNERYKLVSNELGNCSIPFAKMLDMNTQIDSKYADQEGINHLWIDIFPVDGLPENMVEVEQVYKNCNFYRTIFMLNDAKLGEGTTTARKYAKYILKPLAVIYGKGRSIHKIESIAERCPYETSNYVGIITWGLYGAGERMPKNEFEKFVEVEFEGEKFPAFSCWDSYLHGLYHDYMKLPPIEKRKTHDMEAYLINETGK